MLQEKSTPERELKPNILQNRRTLPLEASLEFLSLSVLYGLFYLYMFFLAPLFQKFNQRFFRHLVNQTIGQATKLDHTFIGRIHLYCEIGFLRFLRLSYKEYAGLALDDPI